MRPLALCEMAPWTERPMPGPLKAALVAAQVYAFYFACNSAYTIRLHAVNEYGRIIHEFDPWSVAYSIFLVALPPALCALRNKDHLSS